MSINVDAASESFVAVVSGIDLITTLTDSDVGDIVDVNDQYAVLISRDQPVTQRAAGRPSVTFGPHRLRPAESASDDSDTAEGAGADQYFQCGCLVEGGTANTRSIGDEYRQYAVAQRCLLSTLPVPIFSADVPGSRPVGQPDPFCRSVWRRRYAGSHLIVAIKDKTGEFFSVHCRDMLGAESSDAVWAMFPPVRWPLVRTRAAAGRTILWAGMPLRENDGMPTHEAHMLANILAKHATDRKPVHMHERSASDLVIWENHSVLHRGRWFNLDARRQMCHAGMSEAVGSVGAPADRRPDYSRLAA